MCRLARFCDLSTLAALLGALPRLGACELEDLWKHQAYLHGIARPCAKSCSTEPSDWAPAVHRMAPQRTLDWRLLVLRASKMRGRQGVWIRIFGLKQGCASRVLDEGVDIWVPLMPPAPMVLSGSTAAEQCVAALVMMLGRLVRLEESADQPALGLRLRQLQWGGRPGPIFQGPLMDADHLLLEWAQHKGRGWEMPAWAARSRPSASRAAQAAAVPWPLVQPGGAAASHGVAPTMAAPIQTAPSQPVAACTALVRLVSDDGPGPGGKPPLLQGECWIAVDLGSTTLGGLLQQIVSTLRRGRHRCRWLRSPLQLHLMDTLNQQVPLPPSASGQLLRELGWVQAETLRLVVATGPPNPASGGTATPSKGGADTLHVLVLREDELPSPPSSSAQVPVAADDLPTEAEVAEASRPLVATRVGSGSSLSELTRQRSERCPAQDPGAGGAAQSSASPESPPLVPVATSPPLVETSTPPLCPRNPPRLSPAPSDSLSILTLPFVGDGPAARNLGFHRVKGPWQQMTPHYPPRLLRASRQARQFEFHPTLPNVLLVGETSGGVTVSRTDEFVDEAFDEQIRRPPLVMERSQVLGLSWMRHHPQVALCGVANSGRISFLRYDPMAGPRDRALEEISGAGSFNAPLSSLSVNCSDDFLLASGSSCDVAIYDTQTGCSLQRGIGVHSHLINISRFAHGAPHIFATASLDHTCKVWDLRTKLTRERPVSILRTRGPNVMCSFSPDDRRLMCSGIGDDLTQFDVPSWQMFDRFPCRTPDRSLYMGKRFRRATYLANSRTFVTGATGESHVRFLSCEGKDYGVVDFGSLRRHFRRPGQTIGATAASILGGLTAKAQVPESCGHTLGASVQRAAGREPLRRVTEGTGFSSRSLVSGETQLDLTGANSVSVQSVKANPIIENQVGVLLSSDLSDPQSYVALLHLAPSFDAPEHLF